MAKFKSSYKQNLSRLIQNLNKLKAQALAKGRLVPQDLVIAETRLKDYKKVIEWLHKGGFKVEKGGGVVSVEDQPSLLKVVLREVRFQELVTNVNFSIGSMNIVIDENYLCKFKLINIGEYGDGKV